MKLVKKDYHYIRMHSQRNIKTYVFFQLCCMWKH